MHNPQPNTQLQDGNFFPVSTSESLLQVFIYFWVLVLQVVDPIKDAIEDSLKMSIGSTAF